MNESEGIIRTWIEAWAARDFDGLAGLYARDAVQVRPDGRSEGRAAVVAHLRELAKSFPEETLSVRRLLAAEDAVMLESTQCLAGVPERIVDVFTIAEGHIAEQHRYYDLLRRVQLVGWLRAPGRVEPEQEPEAAPAPTATLALVPAPAPPAEPGPAVRFAIETGPDRSPIAFELGAGALRIGRALDNDTVLADPATSGHHARLERRGERVVLIDLHSTNGTFVNGEQVTETELVDGDLLTIGSNQVRVAISARQVTAPAA